MATLKRSKNLLTKSADYKGIRTLQEEFIDLHLNLLLEDIEKFNRKLMDYLVWYIRERPHESLNNLTPINYLLKYYPESQMYVTRTPS